MSTSVSPKVAAGTVSGAVVVLILAVLSACDITASPEVASALTVLVGALAGYLTPDRLRELGAARHAGRHAEGNTPPASPEPEPVGDSLDAIPADQATSDTKSDAAGL